MPPKLDPEAVAPPPNGVENSEVPAIAGVEGKDGVIVPNPDGAGVDPTVGVEDVPNGVDSWADPVVPKRLVVRLVVGVEKRLGVVGVEKRLEVDGAEAGKLKAATVLEEVAAAGSKDCCGWLVVDAEVCVVGCTGAGKCNVGWTLLAAASCLAASLLFASRNGSLALPRRRWP